MIRVLIADDHAVVRQGLRTFLELQDGIEVVGEAADGEEALDAIGRLEPDVVLMDLAMPRLDGLAAIERLRERAGAPRVIVLTSFGDERILPAIRAGAAGYLLKDVEPPELVRAIHSVHAGESLLDPTLTATLMEQLARGGPRHDAAQSLTSREREVLSLIARGLSNKRIARELGVAEKTVKAHVSNILGKLDLSDRTQAALYAVREGLTGAET